MYPPKGEKIIAQYISTSDYWGMTISEVESEEASATSANMWRIAKPGMFKVFKGTIGMKLEDILPIAMKLAKQIKGK